MFTVITIDSSLGALFDLTTLTYTTLHFYIKYDFLAIITYFAEDPFKDEDIVGRDRWQEFALDDSRFDGDGVDVDDGAGVNGDGDDVDDDDCR